MYAIDISVVRRPKCQTTTGVADNIDCDFKTIIAIVISGNNPHKNVIITRDTIGNRNTLSNGEAHARAHSPSMC